MFLIGKLNDNLGVPDPVRPVVAAADPEAEVPADVAEVEAAQVDESDEDRPVTDGTESQTNHGKNQKTPF